MATTRGHLEAATISSLDGSIVVSCMFNPEKYTVTKSNNYGPQHGDTKHPGGLRTPPKPVFISYGRSQLKLERLLFDTYETGDDLIAITNKLWDFMRPSDPSDPESDPPEIKFEWSSFYFQAFIKQIDINYTLFDKDGNPVRAIVNIEFMESDDPTKHPHERQNPTSGGGPIEQIREITIGDRLDLIAADIYGDSSKWRLIAQRNGIVNPRALRPGQKLTIPPR